jgi:hypothetical protein
MKIEQKKHETQKKSQSSFSFFLKVQSSFSSWFLFLLFPFTKQNLKKKVKKV